MTPFREGVNTTKAFKKLGYKVYRSMPPFGTQANRKGQILISRHEENPVASLRHFLPYAHESAVLRGLSKKLDKLIQFQEPKRSYGTVAKDAALGGVTSAAGTAGLLGVAGLALKKKAPELAGMLSTAAKQHIKVFNPWETVPMMRSLPEASRLFGKQLRGVREVEHMATGGALPSAGDVAESIKRVGINPEQDVADIAAFKNKWGRTPGETMEKSVGMLSGMAATGVGVAGGAALSKGWQKKQQFSSGIKDLRFDAQEQLKTASDVLAHTTIADPLLDKASKAITEKLRGIKLSALLDHLIEFDWKERVGKAISTPIGEGAVTGALGLNKPGLLAQVGYVGGAAALGASKRDQQGKRAGWKGALKGAASIPTLAGSTAAGALAGAIWHPKFSDRLDNLIEFQGNPLYPKIAKSTIEHVPIKKIVSHQGEVKRRVVNKYKDKPGRELPIVHKVGSKYYVEDGNHRIVAKKEKGEKTVRARVFTKELSALFDDLIQFWFPVDPAKPLGVGSRTLAQSLSNQKVLSNLTPGKLSISEQVDKALGRRQKLSSVIFSSELYDLMGFADKYPATVLESVWRKLNKPRLKRPELKSVKTIGQSPLGLAVRKNRMGSVPGDAPGSSASLSSKLDNLIQFQLYQPTEEERKKKVSSLPFKQGEELDYVVQEHLAKRAGKHLDIRIGDKPRGMYSWATKKYIAEALPPGERVQLHPQPIHPHSYNVFQGEIPEGYGAGEVRTRHIGKALITKANPDQINYTVSSQRGSHRLALLNTKLGHLLVREKHPEPPTAQKPDYKSWSPEMAEEHLRDLPEGSIVQPKIDGALVYVKGHKGKLEVFSHRQSKSGDPILHTERFFKGRPYGDLEGKTVLGELYGVRKGRAIEPQELGGILNAHITRSLEKQRQQKVDLKIMPFDLQDRGTYPERLAKLKRIFHRHLPKDKFTLPEEATTPAEALDLHQRIKEGRHPLTSEGVIIHPPHGKMIKVKHTKESNVKIAGTYPGTGKFEGAPGGFYYADEKGKPIGRVGTGFSDETRRALEGYVGRTARIKHQGQYKSGAYRAPSFIAVDESR